MLVRYRRIFPVEQLKNQKWKFKRHEHNFSRKCRGVTAEPKAKMFTTFQELYDKMNRSKSGVDRFNCFKVASVQSSGSSIGTMNSPCHNDLHIYSQKSEAKHFRPGTDVFDIIRK
jgi:hypothetical protein